MAETSRDPEENITVETKLRSKNRGAWWSKMAVVTPEQDVEDVHQYRRKVRRVKKYRCVSKNDMERENHTWDNDGNCIFCPKGGGYRK